jgi:predicted HTH domain antitoxin
MEITLRIPDELARSLGAAGADLSRRSLQALAIDGYRQGDLTQFQVGQLLGLSRFETEDFLARHVDLYDYDPAELDREAAFLENFSKRQ